MTHEQLKFYFQSFDFETFMDWYNNNMIDPYGDYREQTIQYNREDAHNTIKGLYTLETLWHIMEDDRTMIREDDKYIMVTNGDDPYIVTFSTMEDFFKHVDFEGIASYIDTYPETLQALQHKF